MKRLSLAVVWILATALVLAATAAFWYFEQRQRHQPAEGGAPAAGGLGEKLAVKVVQPRRGALQHLTSQVGSVQAYESVKLYAMVSGYLQSQTVDYGTPVQRGKVLAVIAVPEIDKEVEENAAAVDLARSQVTQMKAKVQIARADLEATRAKIVEAEATSKSAAAWVVYRKEQWQRMSELVKSKSIERRLEEEAKEHLEAAKETESSAKAAIVTAKAKVVSAEAQIQLADANVAEARAQVQVVQAKLAKSKVRQAYATITAPLDGVVTRRTMYPGDFVRAAGASGSSVPLFTVERTDRFRVVVLVPDRQVPFVQPGLPAFVELDALPGEKFSGKVSRISESEDPGTRMMHVEIDVPNPRGHIRNGMFGRATIVLGHTPKELSVPSACLVGNEAGGAGVVFVVQNGKAVQKNVKTGMDNGVRVEILQGLHDGDEVVYQPPGTLADGTPVQTAPVAE